MQVAARPRPDTAPPLHGHARQVQKRLDHLDALRGLAALAVLAYHYILFFGFPGAAAWSMTNTPLHIWWDGQAAVAFFFVLSGLVLSYRHFRTTPHPQLKDFNFLSFIVARVCRIWIPYTGMVLISWALFRVTAQHLITSPPVGDLLKGLWNEQPNLRHVLRQIFDARILRPQNDQQILVPQGWTLTLEIAVAMLIPPAVLVAARSPFWLMLSVMLACWLARITPYMFHFALGVVVAQYYVPIVTWLEARRSARLILALISWPIYSYEYVFPNVRAVHPMVLNTWLPAVGSAMIILICSATPPIRNFLARGFVHFVGKVSFSLYLVHMLILICLTPRLLAVLDPSHPGLNWAIGLLFTAAVAIATAGPLYKLLEMPAMSMGKALGKWVDLHILLGAPSQFLARPFIEANRTTPGD
jgi:peptidoglycan/LPS O-acetylase OafA/YrhL